MTVSGLTITSAAGQLVQRRKSTTQLDGWWGDRTMWLTPRFFNVFTRWFDCQFHSTLLDLTDEPLIEAEIWNAGRIVPIELLDTTTSGDLQTLVRWWRATGEKICRPNCSPACRQQSNLC